MEPANVMDQENEEFEDEENLSEDDLPVGIFPEAHPESCHHALKQSRVPIGSQLIIVLNWVGMGVFNGLQIKRVTFAPPQSPLLGLPKGHLPGKEKGRGIILGGKDDPARLGPLRGWEGSLLGCSEREPIPFLLFQNPKL